MRKPARRVYLVQVIFLDVASDSDYVAGQLASTDQIWIRADIRDGRTAEQKSQMLQRLLHDVSTASGAADDLVWVYLCDIPAANMAEYGRVLPLPGQENAWFPTMPDALRERLGPLA
jgi:phenylpyruvate tautomerase PptA (4-oxalocrotonate tautomerase family)